MVVEGEGKHNEWVFDHIGFQGSVGGEGVVVMFVGHHHRVDFHTFHPDKFCETEFVQGRIGTKGEGWGGEMPGFKVHDMFSFQFHFQACEFFLGGPAKEQVMDGRKLIENFTESSVHHN